MKALYLEAVGADLVLKEVPTPSDLSPDEVLVQTELTGICYRDILTTRGDFPRTRLPVILGHEIGGRIVKVGSAVTDFKEGDRVASLIYQPCGRCEYCLSGRENLCRSKKTFGEDVDGSYAEFVKVDRGALVKAPEGVSAAGLAISACVTGMLLHAFRKRAGLKPGETVLVTGAGGGVGVHAVQIAKALGARVIAATSSEWKEASIRKLGASEVVVWKEAFADKVKKLTDGRGVDVVLESVGGPTFSESIKSTAPGGRMIVVGNVLPSPIQFQLGVLILKELSVIGSISSVKQDVEDALRLTVDGRIKPVVHEVLPLADAQMGHRLMSGRASLGRIMLRP
ncbi:MAG TPA: zinc-binding dehydrogenase [Conexivisphaerales archaeon]|nr:zinc-binding dehydrogenase [Conexivisphaerales archaeon]